jgi:hypothetical protein
VETIRLPRRRLLAAAVGLVGGAAALAGLRSATMRELVVVTFGDSILDCGHYNQFGVHPGQLLVRNDDRLFPEFRGRDLSTRRPARLEHRARDGATVQALPAQATGLSVGEPALALLTIGGNDLLGGLITDDGPGIDAFARALQEFLRSLPIRPVLVGTVYDPTFGDDRQNFLGVDPALARRNHRRVNEVLTNAGQRYGRAVDLHAHFLGGDPTWFSQTIEPSLRGASEVRRAFLAAILPEQM